MDFLGSLWDFFWTLFWIFALVAYLIALFSVITDLFRDRELSGWWKALWIVFLLFVPLLTTLVYVIARGDGMAQRSAAVARGRQESFDAYVRDVAGTSPVDQIAKAKELLDAGSLTQSEFDALKAKLVA